jgi:DNA-binding NtrC family response regulator
MRPPRILIADDDHELRRGLRILLEDGGYEAVEADGVRSALVAFRGSPPDLALLDHGLGDGTAFDLMKAFGEIDPRVPVVILTGAADVELAVTAMKRGARDFLPKPVKPQALLAALEAALAERAPSASGERRFDPFVGSSRSIRELAGEASRVAASNSPALILGETGSGKSVLARWIHAHGPRAAATFVDLNCAGLSRELLDSELFGHERGAFTGATSTKTGLLEKADGGTVFLDEIGDIDMAVQGKILKVIEERRFRRVGGLDDMQVDIRLVAATHRDLAERVREGLFRSDLYFRVSTLPITVPPLRDRTEDLPALAERLLTLVPGAAKVTLAPEALAQLRAHSWPGNLRELRNVLERAVLHRNGEELTREDLRLTADAGAGGAPSRLEDLERQHILKVLAEEQYRVPETAERLGMPRSTLYQKLKEFGLQLPRSRRRTRSPE